MENVATSVRVGSDAARVLTELSAKLGRSKAQVIELALKQMEERMFWDEVRDAFARLAEDPAELARQKAEFAAWDQGTARDMQGEEW